MQNTPVILEERYSEIVNIIEDFCNSELNNEYLALAKNLCAEICQKDDKSIGKGKASSWACGIVHALGLRNGLFNGKEKPSIKIGELYKAFGVSGSTGLSKSKEVRNLINIEDEKWSLANINNLDIIESKVINESVLDEVALTTTKKEMANDVNIEKVVKKAVEEVREAIKGLEDDLIENVIDEKLDKANKLADEAWNQKNYNKRVKLAKEALEISKDCSEAYIILSYDNSLSKKDQKELVLKALDAAKRIIGEQNIDKYIGRFLEVEITKPYVSAKYRLGALLWSMGENKEAIEEYKDLIRISPEDNLMIRGILLSWLIIEDRDDEIEIILKTYKNDYLTAYKFSRALYLYKIGNYEDAERALKIAAAGNKFVLGYITRQKRLPKVMPELKKLGTEEEAITYMRTGEMAWNAVSGAVQWVKEFIKNQPF